MTREADTLPDDGAVATGLAPLVCATGLPMVVARRPNDYASSSPTEIVTLALPAGDHVELFLKYERQAADPEPRYRYGVAYTGAVHERLVARLPWPTVPCRGVVAIGRPEARVLVLDHVAGAMRVNEAPDEGGLMAAAEWCGRLHAWGRERCDDPALAFLVRQTPSFHAAWLARARALAMEADGNVAAVAGACAAFEHLAPTLAAAEPTTIHGEYGPQNILWREGAVHPIDWESAAIGPGAIDVAALLFDWPADTIRRGLEAYWHGRGDRPHPAFPSEFKAATLSTALRWLPPPTTAADRGWQAGLARLDRAVAAVAE